MHTCPVSDGPKPHVGGPILPPGCPTVLIGFLPAARMSDKATCTGPPDAIAKGSPTVLIGNMMAARLGDPTMHGGVITAPGCLTVMIGEAGSAGGGGGGGGGAGSGAGGSGGGGGGGAYASSKSSPAPASSMAGTEGTMEKSNAEVRAWYRQEVSKIPKENEKWKRQGLSPKTRAEMAWKIRHDARLKARSMMANPQEIELLRKRDVEEYGSPDGPSFDYEIEKYKSKGFSGDKLYEEIIASSHRTNHEYNKRFNEGNSDNT